MPTAATTTAAAMRGDFDVFQKIGIIDVKHGAIVHRTGEVGRVPAARSQHHGQRQQASLRADCQDKAGATFAQTQPVYDVAALEAFLAREEARAIPLLIGLIPLRSLKQTLFFANEVPGIVVPDSLQEALREAGPEAPEVGMAYAKELYAAAREAAAGVYLVAPYRRPLNVLELIS